MAGEATAARSPMITIAQAIANLTANPRPVRSSTPSPAGHRSGTASQPDFYRPGWAGTCANAAGAGTVQLFVQDIVPRELGRQLAVGPGKDGETGISAFTATWELAHEFGQPAPPLPACHPERLIDELEKLSKDPPDVAEVIDRDHYAMSRRSTGWRRNGCRPRGNKGR